MDSHTQVVIIGSGIAGLFCALSIDPKISVVILAKTDLWDGSTRWAQGGIASAISKEDSLESHIQDTLKAGCGICNQEAVEILVKEGSQIILDLQNQGLPFDKDKDNNLSQTLEAAHSFARVVHAGGDQTGKIVQQFLVEKVKIQKNIQIIENAFAYDIEKKDFGYKGSIFVTSFIKEDKNWLCEIYSKNVVLATGGSGQVYKFTTNPAVSTGDGIYLANKIGAKIENMEYYQFHPTALRIPFSLDLQEKDFLISEAIRGEGGILTNQEGDRFMEKYDSRLELAPRDIVSRAIWSEIEKNSQSVYLDITSKSEEELIKRFPTIYNKLLSQKIKMGSTPIPVSPTAHFQIGGIKTDLNGETNIKNLFACGEVASTGVHGANRLASNSLLEGLVFGKRIAKFINEKEVKHIDAENFHDFAENHGAINNHDYDEISKMKLNLWDFKLLCENSRSNITTNEEYQINQFKKEIQDLMWENVGIVKTSENLEKTLEELNKLESELKLELKNQKLFQKNNRLIFELKSILKTAQIITEESIKNQKSLGSHFLLT